MPMDRSELINSVLREGDEHGKQHTPSRVDNVAIPKAQRETGTTSKARERAYKERERVHKERARKERDHKERGDDQRAERDGKKHKKERRRDKGDEMDDVAADVSTDPRDPKRSRRVTSRDRAKDDGADRGGKKDRQKRVREHRVDADATRDVDRHEEKRARHTKTGDCPKEIDSEHVDEIGKGANQSIANIGVMSGGMGARLMVNTIDSLVVYGHVGIGVWNTRSGDGLEFVSPVHGIESSLQRGVTEKLRSEANQHECADTWARDAVAFLHRWHVGGVSGVRIDAQLCDTDIAMVCGMHTQMRDRLSLGLLMDMCGRYPVFGKTHAPVAGHVGVDSARHAFHVMRNTIVVRGYGSVTRPVADCLRQDVSCLFPRTHDIEWWNAWNAYDEENECARVPDESNLRWGGICGFVWLCTSPNPETSYHLIHYQYDPRIDEHKGPTSEGDKGGREYERWHGSISSLEGGHRVGTVDMVAMGNDTLVHCVEWAPPRDGLPHRGILPHAQSIRSCILPASAVNRPGIFDSLAVLVYGCHTRINSEWDGLGVNRNPWTAGQIVSESALKLGREYGFSDGQVRGLLQMRPTSRGHGGAPDAYTDRDPIPLSTWIDKYGEILRRYIKTGEGLGDADREFGVAVYNCVSRFTQRDVQSIHELMRRE